MNHLQFFIIFAILGVSLSTSLIVAILWYYVRTTKPVIKFEILLK